MKSINNYITEEKFSNHGTGQWDNPKDFERKGTIGYELNSMCTNSRTEANDPNLIGDIANFLMKTFPGVKATTSRKGEINVLVLTNRELEKSYNVEFKFASMDDFSIVSQQTILDVCNKLSK